MPLRDRAPLRAALVARLAQLRGEVESVLHPDARDTAGLANRRAETDDEAVADLESSIDAAQLERDQRELEEVAAALERIDTPAFGDCAECGEPIAWERLSALPQALRCVRCESALEGRGATPASRSL